MNNKKMDEDDFYNNNDGEGGKYIFAIVVFIIMALVIVGFVYSITSGDKVMIYLLTFAVVCYIVSSISAHNNKQKQKNVTLNIKCPICNSLKIQRISNINRTASILAWGMASSKITKQFNCKNCGYKW